MFFKKWPYWLKGAIIFEIIFIIIFIIILAINLINQKLFFKFFYDIFIFMFMPAVLMVYPLSSECFFGERSFLFGPKKCPIGETEYGIILFVSSVVFYFVIGALFGWIYKKIKNKK